MEVFRELNALARWDETVRALLNRLFYGLVLGHPTGYAEERPLEEIVEQSRQVLADRADDVIARWRSLGDELHATSDSPS